MAPVFSHGDLRLYLLSLLAEEPRHGYDIIQALGERTGGMYTPSAGTVYPRLAKLEDEGLVTKTVDGRKTVYAITEAGRAEVAARAGELQSIESDLADSVRLIAANVRDSVTSAMKSLRADLADAARAEAAAEPSATPDPLSPRAIAKAQLARADAALGSFRSQVHADLRAHIARGRDVPAGLVDRLEHALGTAADEVRRALGR